MAYDASSDDDEAQSIVARILNTILLPLRPLLSKSAQRAYISTLLLFLTSLFLLAIAVVAYLTFYFAYVPTRGFTQDIHLQFSPFPSPYPATQPSILSTPNDTPQQDASPAQPVQEPMQLNPHPHATQPLPALLSSAQPYTITLHLTLPRTPSNLATGNFMLDLTLLAPALSTPPIISSTLNLAAQAAGQGPLTGERVLARSARTAILKYRSGMLEGVDSLMRVPWYVLGWRRGLEEEELRVVMMEGVEFEKGWRNVPGQVRVEIRGREVMQVYGCKVVFEARLQGLRYLMYNHRIISFIVFTAIFYAIEVTSLLFTWAVLSFFIFPSTTGLYDRKRIKSETPNGRVKADPEGDNRIIKNEAQDGDEDASLSDTSRTFPTYSRQPPLRYSSPATGRIKKESEDSEEVPLAAGEAADDEDEDEGNDFILEEEARFLRDRDSGLGTSMESSTELRDSVRRRRASGRG